jgi:hypothetical protein
MVLSTTGLGFQSILTILIYIYIYIVFNVNYGNSNSSPDKIKTSLKTGSH